MNAGGLCRCFLASFIFFIYPVTSFSAEPNPPKHLPLGAYPVVFNYLTEYISYLVDEEDLAGLSIAIINGQDIVWKQGFGFSDKENKVKATPNTRYQAGAVTGLLTSALVMKLAAEEKLNIDDDIKKYLPEITIQSREATPSVISIRNLLTHHAGLPINVFKRSWEKQPPSFHSLENSSVNLTTSYPSNTIYAFSNVGYSLLGLIIEKTTAQSFSSAMESYVLAPLKMNDSSVNNDSRIIDEIAVGYQEGEVAEKLLPRDTPSVGLVTTVVDLSYFVRQYFGGQPLKRDGLDEMIKIQNADVKLDIGRQVGFSWFIDGMDVKNAGPVIWRGGAAPYHRSRVAMLPEHQLGVVILSNDSQSWEAIEKISEKTLQLMLEAKTGIKQPILSEDNDKVVLTQHDLGNDTFANAYSGFVGHIKISHEAESEKMRYHADILGWPFILFQDENNHGWYKLQYDLFGFIPIDISWIAEVKVRPAIVDQHRVLLVYYKGRQRLFAQRFETQKIHKKWQALLGEYRIQNADALLESMKVKRVELKVIDDDLFLVYRLPFLFGLDLTVPLKTLSDTEAIIPGLGTGLNETVSVRTLSGKPILVYSGYFLEKDESAKGFFE